MIGDPIDGRHFSVHVIADDRRRFVILTSAKRGESASVWRIDDVLEVPAITWQHELVAGHGGSWQCSQTPTGPFDPDLIVIMPRNHRGAPPVVQRRALSYSVEKNCGASRVPQRRSWQVNRATRRFESISPDRLTCRPICLVPRLPQPSISDLPSA